MLNVKKETDGTLNSRKQRYLDDLQVRELSDGVVRQVDAPAAVQLAHASSVLQGLGPVQTAAAGGGPVDCRGHRGGSETPFQLVGGI